MIELLATLIVRNDFVERTIYNDFVPFIGKKSEGNKKVHFFCRVIYFLNKRRTVFEIILIQALSANQLFNVKKYEAPTKKAKYQKNILV